MPPQVLIRAADGRPMDLQDMLPSNTLFKLFVFTGDTAAATLNDLASDVEAIMHKFATRVELCCILSSSKQPDFGFMDLPLVLRPHWSR
jgi:phenol 2-monooxygenase